MMAPFLLCKISTSFFSLAFYSMSWFSFWFMMVLLLDFRIDKSLILFFIIEICSYSSLIVSFLLTSSFSRSLFLSVIFFLKFYYYLSLSLRFWVCTWYFVIFQPFFSRFSFVWLSIYCLIRSHSLFRSQQFSRRQSYCFVFYYSYYQTSYFSSLRFFKSTWNCWFLCFSSLISLPREASCWLNEFFSYYLCPSDVWRAVRSLCSSSLSWSFSILPQSLFLARFQLS